MRADNREIMRRLIAAAQEDLPLVERPFAVLAERHGVGEEQLLEALREWQRAGVMRRYGALVSHRKLGFECNAMVVWQVPPERVEQVGRAFADDPEVTHCYERRPAPALPYNLYTMIHAHSEDECRRKVEHLARWADAARHEVLISTREFKKDSPRYGPASAPVAAGKEPAPDE